MNRKSVLLRTVKGMFLLLGLAFGYILFRSLSGPSVSPSSSSLFDDVQYGQTALRRYQGQRVWVTRLTPQQRREAILLNDELVDPKSGCASSQDLCLVQAQTQRDGIEIVFSQAAPAQLTADRLWFGGFVDPVSGVLYDRLGRAYRLPATPTTDVALKVLSPY